MGVLKRSELKDEKWFEKEPWGAFWEKGYRSSDVSTMGGPSHEICELVPALKPGARTLDLGCGEGRNSFYLAGKGFEATAIDRSADAIEKLKNLAKKVPVKLNAFAADIVNLEIAEKYDLVMAHGVLYYLTNMEWRDLLADVKAQTNPGGFNAYSVFIFNDEYPRPPEFKSARYTHSFTPNELKEFYSDWEILRYDVYVKWDQHPGIPIHAHPIEKLVARKPGGSGPEPIIETIPIKPDNMPMEKFLEIPMGMSKSDLLDLCGEPDIIDTYHMEGVQIGAVSVTTHGHDLNLWFYGRTVVYVINDRVWGRSLFSTPPVRLKFKV